MFTHLQSWRARIRCGKGELEHILTVGYYAFNMLKNMAKKVHRGKNVFLGRRG